MLGWTFHLSSYVFIAKDMILASLHGWQITLVYFSFGSDLLDSRFTVLSRIPYQNMRRIQPSSTLSCLYQWNVLFIESLLLLPQLECCGRSRLISRRVLWMQKGHYAWVDLFLSCFATSISIESMIGDLR